MTDGYSSSVSGDRPDEVARIRRLVDEAESPPPLWADVAPPPPVPGFTDDLNAQRSALGLRPAPEALADMTEPAESDRWLARSCLRPNTMALVVGPRGSRKSYLRTDAALAFATGGTGGPLWSAFDVECGPLRVLILDEDNGPLEEWRRDEAHMAARGIRRGDLTGLWRLSWSGLLLERPADQLWLVEQIETLGIQLLILDPLGQFYGVPERREDLMPVVKFLRGLLRRFPDLTVLLVHHVRKPGANVKRAALSLDDVRGAEWADRADVVVLVSDLGEGRLKLEVTKRVPPATVVLEQGSAGGFRLVSMGETAVERSSTEDRVMACIDAGAQSVADIHEALGISERAIWTAVASLRKRGILEPGTPLRRPAEDAS
ncbi:MAG: AAA family ATPase [Chloroflexi bacterium]|nr:AAA family ATPase [Chloroflexota bacterium]